MARALLQGLKAVGRSWGLAVLLLAVNLGLAALLAIPLAGTLERDLARTDAASGMLYGTDYGWWSRWSDQRSGFLASFSPEILGSGLVFRNLDLLLKGALPASLYREGDAPEAADPLVLSLVALNLLAQSFLLGGVLGVFRGGQGRWTMRGLFHGSGFYFGRLLRIALIALVADGLLLLLNLPFARWADRQAVESVSENAALAWVFGRHALLLIALLLVNLVSSYAKVILVLEERSSALLAVLSAAGFCVANPLRTLGHYLSLAALGIGLTAAWSVLDGAWSVTGYKTQAVALLLGEGLVLGRIALRLALLAGQMALYRERVEAER
jgi:hypothetical protein